MKQSRKRLLSVAVALVLIVASFVIYFSLIQPTYSDYQNVRAQVISRENLINSEKSAISKVQDLINAYKGESQLQETLSSVLPTSPSLAEAMAQIDGLAQNNKLPLSSLDISLQPIQSLGSSGNSPPNNSTSSQSALRHPLGLVNFQIRLSGSYENLKSFIQNLETNIRILDIQSLRVGSSPERAKSDNYDYSLTIVAYYQAQ